MKHVKFGLNNAKIQCKKFSCSEQESKSAICAKANVYVPCSEHMKAGGSF